MLSHRFSILLCVVTIFTASCAINASAQEVQKSLPQIERITISPTVIDGISYSGWAEFDTSSIIWNTRILRHSQPLIDLGFGSDDIRLGKLRLRGIDGKLIYGGWMPGMGVFCPFPGTYTAQAVRENTGDNVGSITVTIAAENDQPCTLIGATVMKDQSVIVDYTIDPAWAGQPVSFYAFLSATPDGNPYDSTSSVIGWMDIVNPSNPLLISSDPRLSSGEHKGVKIFEGKFDPVTPLIPTAERPYVIIESNYVIGAIMASNIDHGVLPMLIGQSHASKISMRNVCPHLSASCDFAAYLDAHHGQVPCCVLTEMLDKYPANNNHNGGLWFAGVDANGHKYLEINPLTSSSEMESASEAMNVFRDNFCTIFPLGGAKDITSGGNVARNGDRYSIALNVAFPRLHIGLGPYQVICSELSTYHFKLTAYGSHILEGTAIHGVFEDRCGHLWMFQQGRGVKDETWTSSVGSRFLGYEWMWDSEASNLSKKLGG